MLLDASGPAGPARSDEEGSVEQSEAAVFYGAADTDPEQTGDTSQHSDGGLPQEGADEDFDALFEAHAIMV